MGWVEKGAVCVHKCACAGYLEELSRGGLSERAPPQLVRGTLSCRTPSGAPASPSLPPSPTHPAPPQPAR